MIRDLYLSLMTREQRMFRWSAAAVAAALWLSSAWADPRMLVAVPLIAGGFALWVKRRRRYTLPDEDDQPDWSL